MSLLSTLSLASFLIIFLHYSKAEYAESCETPNGQIGKCMPLKSCSSLFSLLLEIRNSNGVGKEKQIDFLQNSQCDNIDGTPHVCCAPEHIQMNPEVREHLEKLPCSSGPMFKIANGSPARLLSYRFMTLLKYHDNDTFLCGGSLIDERHVLTAAHCLNPYQPTAVRVGEYNLSSEIDCTVRFNKKLCLHPYEDIGIEEIITHPQYKFSDKDYSYDIAILRLERPVEFDKHHAVPICLPITEELQDGVTEFTVAGWGLTQYRNRSNVLLYTSVPLRPKEFCYDQLGIVLNDDHICAGGKQFKDSCRGDSGGPLFSSRTYVDEVARPIQYGIVSVGARRCGETNTPAIYTDVIQHLQWITDHLKVYENEHNYVRIAPTIAPTIVPTIAYSKASILSSLNFGILTYLLIFLIPHFVK